MMPAARPNTSMLDHALELARLGLKTFPLVGKKPLVKGWPQKATANEDAIRLWWNGRFQGANIGYSTAGLIVLDIDSGDGGAALDALQRTHGRLPATWTVTTGKGEHYIFEDPTGGEVRNIAQGSPIHKDVHVRASGGYCVGPGSIHPERGTVYEWEVSGHPEDVAMAIAPGWLVQLLARDEPRSPRADPVDGPILKGSRNATLASLAGTMRRRGSSENVIYAALAAENEERCIPPLEDPEVRGIAASVARYEPEPTWEPPVDEQQEVENKPLIWLQQHLVFAKVPIAGTRMLGRRQGDFQLILRSGESIDLGRSADVLNPRAVKHAIFESIGEVIMTKGIDWDSVAKAIRAAAVIEDLPLDDLSECRQWLAEFERWYAPRDVRYNLDDPEYRKNILEDKPAFPTNCFWTTDDQLVIRLMEFRSWVKKSDQFITVKDAGGRLRRLGFTDKPIHVKSGGRTINQRFWFSESGFDPHA